MNFFTNVKNIFATLPETVGNLYYKKDYDTIPKTLFEPAHIETVELRQDQTLNIKFNSQLVDLLAAATGIGSIINTSEGRILKITSSLAALGIPSNQMRAMSIEGNTKYFCYSTADSQLVICVQSDFAVSDVLKSPLDDGGGF